MNKYNCNIENGIKSAFFSLEGLIHNEKIKDSELDSVLSQLESLIIKSQDGKIDNIGEDL